MVNEAMHWMSATIIDRILVDFFFGLFRLRWFDSKTLSEHTETDERAGCVYIEAAPYSDTGCWN